MKLEERKSIEEAMEDLDQDDYLSDMEEDDLYIENNNKYLSHEINVIKKYKVFFYFDLNKNKKFAFPIITDGIKVDDYHVYDLIKYLVKKINDSNIVIKDENNNYSVSLKDIDEEEENMDFYINNYELKPFEFWKKKDCQNYSSTDSLKSINEENISFFPKNPLNVMLMKQF